MSQSFHVVRCVNCNQFQNHIVKKSNKWPCKLCGTKQSLQQVFATGPSIDCRKIVQQLNLGQGELEQTVKAAKIARFERSFEEQSDELEVKKANGHKPTYDGNTRGPFTTSSETSDSPGSSFLRVVPKERSKWTKYSESADSAEGQYQD